MKKHLALFILIATLLLGTTNAFAKTDAEIAQQVTNELRADLTKWATKTAALEAELNEINKKIQVAREELAAIAANQLTQDTALQEKTAALQAQIDAQEKAIKDLYQKLAAITTEYNAQIDQLNAEATAIKRENEALRKDYRRVQYWFWGLTAAVIYSIIK